MNSDIRLVTISDLELVTNHFNDNFEIGSNDGGPIYECQRCEETFTIPSTIGDLLDHLKTHGISSPI